MLDEKRVAGFYDQSYQLPQLGEAGDRARAEAYGQAIYKLASREPFGLHPRILDLGCGSGALVRWLADAVPTSEVYGLDPSLPKAQTKGRITLARGRIEDLEPALKFDWIVSINTIEHVTDPAQFLSDMAARLTQAGKISLICPSFSPANDELLFFDHLWTFSVDAIQIIAKRAGLYLNDVSNLTGPISGFTCYSLSRTMTTQTQGAQTPSDSATYLSSWQGLDEKLSEFTAGGVAVDAFGAGQMAALLRAYAPRVFSQIETFWVDDPSQAWPIGNVARYNRVKAQDRPVICLVNSRAQDMVDKRLTADGIDTILLRLAE